MSIVEETRREGLAYVEEKKTVRQNLILSVLEGRQMTVSEIVMELYESGAIPYYDRNFVAPRLTELKDAGKVRVVGKRECIMSGRNIAVWEVVK